ncbi:hypothetical protein GWI33_000049 [Rhynchophorus ferrugineus]|uniref:Exostosin-2 n=1 Tax=Rhynchophorus ferrugineus TaxID=354439 RepID=A0A834IX21_RHYFE|nr:hypothetical protein GWI33_000049 [Rhynchophorus ferrugineus]
MTVSPKLPEVKLSLEQSGAAPRDTKCTHWDCFDIYRCGRTGHERIAVYVYPLRKYIDENGNPLVQSISREFYVILRTIVNSKYYTTNPKEACIFIPSIDILNEERIWANFTSRALSQLPFWSGGQNHLLFNLVAGRAPNYLPVVQLDVGNAMLAGADFDSHTFRYNYDIALPLYSPVAKLGQVQNTNFRRKWKVMSSQLNIDPYYLDALQTLRTAYPNQMLLLDACHPHLYANRCDIIDVFRGERRGQFVLLEAMAANCIPVIVMDGRVMPFEHVIDWNRVAIFIMESHVSSLMDVLKDISDKRINQMRESLKFLYEKYFSSLDKIVLTTLDVIQDRVYPHRAKTYDEWNLLPKEINTNPLFYPSTAVRSVGFTAVILTYDRIQSLFTLIERLAKVPSLMKIVVVWNNQIKNPPPLSEFPKISKPINVIKTKANKLSNRFYPYREIETEAILHIDDDIVMLTSDEIEFGFEVWREFPDRIVGFPSRTHVFDNVTNSWKYESEWLNEISMVLTGAAFLHKYWSHLYSTALPENIRQLVDQNMNCEDIAMNFLVANITNKPPIKVTPRKKFKCPECTNTEMLSADKGHLESRSHCVDEFSKIFGRMPLKSVEFRADPVLFKDPFPEKLKRFNNIGSL